jgi:hypothetical protein
MRVGQARDGSRCVVPVSGFGVRFWCQVLVFGVRAVGRLPLQLECFHDGWDHAISNITVMAGPVPAIRRGTMLVAMAGTGPAMTQGATIDVPVILKRS